MHAKYEVSISYGLKVIAKVKVDNRQTDRQTNKQTDRQTGQKQYAPDHSIRGHKNPSHNNKKRQKGINDSVVYKKTPINNKSLISENSLFP